MRPIDANALKDAFAEMDFTCANIIAKEIGGWFLKDVIPAEIDKASTLDCAPVIHAGWIPSSPFTDTKECSKCGYNILSEEIESPYCPWCGAKMDGKEDGQNVEGE